ncbi:MAG: insulinase family protein [Candidatus Sumerlaeia bacterium]|nr:insulinase family protein [Candidatus Sumerlaeia bacterium]
MPRGRQLPYIILLLPVLYIAGCFRPDPVAPLGRQYFTMPEPGQQRIGDVNQMTLENGLTIIHRRNPVNSLVGLTVYIRMGSAQEDTDKAGQTSLLMRTLLKGTRNRDADTISEELARLGASISPRAGHDFSSVSLRCVVDDLPEAMDLLADVLLNPTFPNDQVDLEREKLLASIRMSEDQLASFAWKRFEQAIYGGHPYGTPIDGHPETLAALTPIEIGTTHRDFFVPSSMILSVVGNIDSGELRRLVETHLGQVTLDRRQRYLVDKVVAPSGGITEYTRDSNQGFVVLGHLVCPLGHPDRPAIDVASTILGSGMSSRLFADLRDRKGLAYSVGSVASFLQNQGYLAVYIGTNAETINRWFPPAAGGAQISATSNDLWEHLLALRNEPVTAEELERAKNYIAGSYLRAHETNLQQAAYLGFWEIAGLGLDYDERYIDQIRAVTARDIMRVANKYFLDPTVVVVRPSGIRR